MNKIAIAAALVAAGVTALAQGTVDFSTYKGAGGSDVNAPVSLANGTKLGGAYLGQLYVKTDLMPSFQPVGTGLAFREGAGGVPTGLIVAGKLVVDGIAGGTSVQVVLKAWELSGGTSFEAARAAGKLYGESLPITLTLGNELTNPPETPPVLAGLQAFSLIPEPSTLALGMLGAAALLLRRRS